MTAFSEIAIYLIDTLFSLYLVALVVRGILHASRADFFNPVSQFIVKITNPPLKSIQRMLPNRGRIDFGVIALAFLVQLASIALILLIAGLTLPNPLILIIWSAVGIVGLVVKIYFFALIAMIVVSWVAPGSRHPAIGLLYQVTEPVMAPIRALLPNLGGLDFSPILLFVTINILEIGLRHVAVAVGLPTQLVMGI